MKFKFHLESVLNVRNHQEKIEKQKLAALLSEESVLRIEMQKKQERLREFEEKAHTGEVFTHTREKTARNFSLIETGKLRHIKQQIQQKQNHIETQRRNVLEANKELKVIQKLKKKALMEYLKEVNRKDQIVQNEIATRIFFKHQQS